MPGVQPGFLVEELSSAPQIVKADPRWQEAMKRRGFTDFSRVHVDGWAPGTVGLTTAEGPRLIRALSFDRTNATSSVYSRPIEGLDIVVDMNQRKVVEFVDRGVVPISKDAAQLEAKNAGALRAALKPLRITQPNGVDFQIRGNEIRWQKWRFRYALHPREGLVLYTVAYEEMAERSGRFCTALRSRRWSFPTATETSRGPGGTHSTWVNTGSVGSRAT